MAGLTYVASALIMLIVCMIEYFGEGVAFGDLGFGGNEVLLILF